MPETDALIIGAGLSGLSCARALGRNYVILEKEARPGGLCRTESRNGYTFDITGHYLHFAESDTKRLVMRLLRGNILMRKRDSRVLLRGREGSYPFQTNLGGHDPAVIRDCLAGLFAGGRRRDRGRKGESFAGWVLRTQGGGFARHFMLPFNRKMFRADPESLTALQGGRFVPRPSPGDIVRGALLPGRESFGYNALIWYPLREGIEALPRALAGALKRQPTCEAGALKVFWKRGIVIAADGRAHHYDVLVNTAPLPVLLGMLAPEPPGIARIRRALKWIGVITGHFLLSRPSMSRAHWIYLPERRFAAYRYGYPSNINRRMAPRGCSLLSAEYSYIPGRRPGQGRLAARLRRDMQSLGAIKSSRSIRDIALTDAPFAYVIFDKEYAAARAAAMRFLARHRILSIGRYGGWQYGGMSDAIRDGLDAGERIAAHGWRGMEKWVQ